VSQSSQPSQSSKSSGHPVDVIYLVSRFPKVTETFIADEIAELRRLGMDIEILALIHQHEDAIQPSAERLLPLVRFGSRSIAGLLSSQWRWLRRRPARLLRLWLSVLTGNGISPAELLKSITTTLVAVEWADRCYGRKVHRLHAHWATHPALAAYVMAGLLDIEYSFTAHAHDIFGPNAMLRKKLSGADFVVTISDFNLRLLRERYDAAAARVRVLHCGIAQEDFSAQASRDAEGSGPIRLLCVASLTDYKGHRHLLDALALLKDRGHQVSCTLVGDGPMRQELELRAVELGVADQTHFLGRRPSPEVRAQLAVCDVFVLPSVQTPDGFMEGIPVALMEAMAAGCPVIASELSGIPELVENEVSGLLVQPGDAEAIADAVARLSEHPELRIRLADAARATVAEGFDLRTNVAVLHSWLQA
jgi:colanic acid/amylovoran biosynthesis glycosyltransferase